MYILERENVNSGNIKDYNKAIYANFKNKAGWLEYNLKRCLDDEEQKLGEKKVIRGMNEIITFYEIIEKIRL